MYVSQVHITNFRIFKDFRVALSSSLNLIVGENNSGKTALIDAIRYALDTNSSDWIRIQESDFRRGESHFSIQLKFRRHNSSSGSRLRRTPDPRGDCGWRGQKVGPLSDTHRRAHGPDDARIPFHSDGAALRFPG